MFAPVNCSETSTVTTDCYVVRLHGVLPCSSMVDHTWPLNRPIDLRRTLRFALPHGPGLLFGGDLECSYALSTEAGPATVTVSAEEGSLVATAVGRGAQLAIDAVPRTVGLDDNPDEFLSGKGLLRDQHQAHRGLRLGSSGRVFDTLLPAVIGQRVTTSEAKSSYRRLVAATGEPAPGDLGLRLPPRPEVLANMSYVDLHPFGIERNRAQLVIEVARRAGRLEQIIAMTREDAERRLAAVRGVGPWTIAQVMGAAWGDRDAVPTGDLHLPNTVAWALAKEPRASDKRMLELLEPFRPLRRRAITLIKLSGIHAPRYGPRSPKSAIN